MIDRILVLGAGNMGGALIRGLMRTNPELRVHVCDPNAGRLATLAHEFPALAVFEDVTVAARVFFAPKRRKDAPPEVVALCVKPQDLPAVAGPVARHAPKAGVLYVSILAGMTTADLAAAFRTEGPVVRAMPNIAATVGLSATAMCANARCAAGDRSAAESLFAAVGRTAWTREELMDAVTGLSGSGPAYIYMVIEALVDGGVKMGMPRALASELAIQTVLGSAALVQATGLHPAILRDQVTTPGGTTIHAIHELEAHGIRAMLMGAVATATECSRRLREPPK